jgi:hypothetical protein
MRGEGRVAASQPMSTSVHRSPNKLWRSLSILSLWKNPLLQLASSFAPVRGGAGSDPSSSWQTVFKMADTDRTGALAAEVFVLLALGKQHSIQFIPDEYALEGSRRTLSHLVRLNR